jgi:hypothetical protein
LATISAYLKFNPARIAWVSLYAHFHSRLGFINQEDHRQQFSRHVMMVMADW